MKASSLFLFFSLILMSPQFAQESPLPYHQIPDAPEDYRAGNVLSRMIDGLGYRYYWATEGLLPEDLAYRPSGEARSTSETLDHILGLSYMIVNTARNVPHKRPDSGELSFEEKRRQTLDNFAEASSLLKGMNKKAVGKLHIVFQREDQRSEVPFWNLINGPIEDAVYHTGQVVSFRRSSGNPMHPGVSVLWGKTRESGN